MHSADRWFKLSLPRVDERFMAPGAPAQIGTVTSPPEDQLLTKLFDTLPDAVVVIDTSCSVRWGNRAAEKLFGRSMSDAVGISGLDLVHPEDLELVLRSLSSVQSKEVGSAIEIRVNASTGWRLVELLGAPISWVDEAAVLLSIRDVTERRRFELARGEEARFRSLVQNSAAVTMLVSRSGNVDSVSGALTRLLGHDPELVEQRPLADIVLSDDHAALSEALEARGSRCFCSASRDGRGSVAPSHKGRLRPVRTGDRQPARRPNSRRVRGLCPRHPCTLGSRAPSETCTVATHCDSRVNYRAEFSSWTILVTSQASTSDSPSCGECPNPCCAPERTR